MNENTWTFKGEIINTEPTATKKGAPFTRLVIGRMDGDYERLCVCELWGDPRGDLVKGAVVEATGRIQGRRANDGRYFAGLTCTKIVIADAKPAVADDGGKVPF